MTDIKVGDYVKIIGNAPRSMWESGYVMDINQDGYLIKYGRLSMLGCYGLSIRKQQKDLIEIFEEVCHICGQIKPDCIDDMNTSLGNPGFICLGCQNNME